MTTCSILSASGILPGATTLGAANSADGSFAAVFNALAKEDVAQKEGLPATPQAVAAAVQSPKVCLDSTRGKFAVNIDEYFAPRMDVDLDNDNTLPPLLFPTADNIATLASHSSARFRQLLANFNIPAAPAAITYGSDGQMQLPHDYAYANELRDALQANPALQRELSTLNALTSHYALMQESLPFLQAYGAANTQAEINQVVQQYSYLFNGARAPADIELVFSATGEIKPTVNGQPLEAGVNRGQTGELVSARA